jgi:hypothetical protein
MALPKAKPQDHHGLYLRGKAIEEIAKTIFFIFNPFVNNNKLGYSWRRLLSSAM